MPVLAVLVYSVLISAYYTLLSRFSAIPKPNSTLDRLPSLVSVMFFSLPALFLNYKNIYLLQKLLWTLQYLLMSWFSKEPRPHLHMGTSPLNAMSKGMVSGFLAALEI